MPHIPDSDQLDLSDEATGLPPLHLIEPDGSILALRWVLGVEGLVEAPIEPEPMAVRFLSMRGLVLDGEGQAVWGQCHIALPAGAVRPMLEQWLEALDREEADLPEHG